MDAQEMLRRLRVIAEASEGMENELTFAKAGTVLVHNVTVETMRELGGVSQRWEHKEHEWFACTIDDGKIELSTGHSKIADASEEAA